MDDQEDTSRKRCFSKQGYSDLWRKKKKEIIKLIAEAKKNYRRKEEIKLTTKGSHKKSYRTIQNLKSHDKPKNWTINDLNPEMSDAELVEDLATYLILKQIRNF